MKKFKSLSVAAIFACVSFMQSSFALNNVCTSNSDSSGNYWTCDLSFSDDQTSAGVSCTSTDPNATSYSDSLGCVNNQDYGILICDNSDPDTTVSVLVIDNGQPNAFEFLSIYGPAFDNDQFVMFDCT